MRVHKKGKAIGSRSEVWYHLSYGNFNSEVFTLMPLAFVSSIADGIVALQYQDGQEPLNVWCALRLTSFIDMDKRKLDLEMWRISNSKDKLADFKPSDLRVVLTHPALRFKLWRPPSDDDGILEHSLFVRSPWAHVPSSRDSALSL